MNTLPLQSVISKEVNVATQKTGDAVVIRDPTRQRSRSVSDGNSKDQAKQWMAPKRIAMIDVTTSAWPTWVSDGFPAENRGTLGRFPDASDPLKMS